MKKRQNKTKDDKTVINLLKSLKPTKSDRELLESTHQVLSEQLKMLKNATRAPNKSFGLIFYDSRFLALPEGVRPAAVETARLKYQIENKQLQISLYPISSERFEVIGQLSGLTSGKILSVILKKGRTQATTKTNNFQIFRFENVQKASYELEIFDGKESIAKIDLNI